MDQMLQSVLDSGWVDFNLMLKQLREDQIKVMLESEVESKEPRVIIIERLHQRYTKLRSMRERAELLKGLV